MTFLPGYTTGYGYYGAASSCDKYKTAAAKYRKAMWAAGLLTKTRRAYELKANAEMKKYHACKMQAKATTQLATAKPKSKVAAKIAAITGTTQVKKLSPDQYNLPPDQGFVPSDPATQAAAADPTAPVLSPGPADMASSTGPLGIPTWGWVVGAIVLLGGGYVAFGGGKKGSSTPVPSSSPARASSPTPLASASPYLAAPSPAPGSSGRGIQK